MPGSWLHLVCIYYNQAMSAKAAFPVLWDALKLWWEDWSNQMLVALIALLLSLSVVLYPAAIFGVYEQALDLTHGVRTGIVGFWKGFKGHLRQSLPWGLLNLFVLALQAFNVWFYHNVDHPIALPLMILMLGLGLFWLVWQFFSVNCFFLQEEKKLIIAWKNGLAVMLLHPGFTALIALAVLILLGLSVTTFIPFFLGSVPLTAILGLRAVQTTIKQDES